MEGPAAMTRPVLVALVSALALAACGADGPPRPPADPEPPAGSFTISGEGRFGVTASNP
jgi:predicted small lipoprotein YifL